MNASTWLANPGDRHPTERDTKDLLSSYGIRAPRGVLVTGGSATVVDFDGPYAVKAASPDIVHKTEARAVKLNISRDSLTETLADFSLRFPGVPVLVEQMVGGIEVELIAGAFRDPALGPAIMVGAGGTLAELYNDVVFRLIPVSSGEIDRMLDELRLAAILRGYRGVRVDRPALVRTLGGLCRLVEDLGDRFSELDVNPLVFAAGEWIALDASLVLSHSAGGSR